MRRLIIAGCLCALALPAFAQQQRSTVELPTQTVTAILNFLVHPPASARMDPGDVMGMVQAIQLCSQITASDSPAGVCDIVLQEFRRRAAEVEKARADGKVAGKTEAEASQKACITTEPPLPVTPMPPK